MKLPVESFSPNVWHLFKVQSRVERSIRKSPQKPGDLRLSFNPSDWRTGNRWLRHPWFGIFALTFSAWSVTAQTNASFDGRPWNISSGNLSVSFIQASPIGAFPKTNYLETPPSVESQVKLRNLGLVANEDYVAWGAVERAPGKWQWDQHDAMEKTLHQAGLKYVVYDWVHFPPVWLREGMKDKRTLMQCMEHKKEANYLSVFDPRTIAWYDHFYKNLHEHFGNRIDDVYACILGPYGEGNYPLMVPDWVNMGHCHEGYWCGDSYALQAFQIAMKKKYSVVSKLNTAWATDYASFDAVSMPAELSQENFKAAPDRFPKATDKRRWLDFITWYHQAIIDFTERSVQTVLKYFPPEKVRAKPGGTAAGINPIPWGTYSPGYAKMAQPYRIVLQPADCQGAVFADKWAGTAYQFYGVKECTEPAGSLDAKAFAQRIFSDASCGASQLFSYEFEAHASDIQKYVHLLTGKPGETEVALYCPTTLYRLGGDVQPTIKAAYHLRDICEFDVLDELIINDGALNTNRYKALLIFQPEIIDQPILDKFSAFLNANGTIYVLGSATVKDVEGLTWPDEGRVKRIAKTASPAEWRPELLTRLNDLKGVDGKIDGLWTCRRGSQVFVLNTNDKEVEHEVDGKKVKIAARTIWENR
jgi:glycosyl hydrolase family 14